MKEKVAKEWLEQYPNSLVELLAVPALDRELPGATSVVRCTYAPSFSQEFTITLCERAENVQLAIHAASEAVWVYLQNIYSPAPFEPAIRPSVTIERLWLPPMQASWRELVSSAWTAAPPAEPSATTTDGMRVELALARPDATRQQPFRLHRCDSPLPVLARELLEFALGVAEWESSRSALRPCRAYFS